ncbi:MAG: hypothetical protein AAGA30_11435 [Planctomycetota bacterium]
MKSSNAPLLEIATLLVVLIGICVATIPNVEQYVWSPFENRSSYLLVDDTNLVELEESPAVVVEEFEELAQLNDNDVLVDKSLDINARKAGDPVRLDLENEPQDFFPEDQLIEQIESFESSLDFDDDENWEDEFSVPLKDGDPLDVGAQDQDKNQNVSEVTRDLKVSEDLAVNKVATDESRHLRPEHAKLDRGWTKNPLYDALPSSEESSLLMNSPGMTPNQPMHGKRSLQGQVKCVRIAIPFDSSDENSLIPRSPMAADSMLKNNQFVPR